MASYGMQVLVGVLGIAVTALGVLGLGYLSEENARARAPGHGWKEGPLLLLSGVAFGGGMLLVLIGFNAKAWDKFADLFF